MSNLKIDQTLICTKKSSFYRILVIIQSHSGPVGDVDGTIEVIPGTYKREKPNNFTGFDKVHLKSDCFKGSKVKGIRETILTIFALNKPPGHKKNKQSRVKLFYKVKNSVLSQITFYLEDDDHKPVDFNGESLGFTCQLIKK